MKKLRMTFIAGALVAAVGAHAAEEPVPCDVQDSVLCVAVGSHFDFEEDSDHHRVNEVSGLPGLLEQAGEDIARAAGKLGDGVTTYAADFSGTHTGLRIPFGGPALGGVGPYTVSMWFKLDSVSSDHMVLFDASDGTDITGPRLYFDNDNDNLVFCATVNADTYTTSCTTTAASTITSTTTWYHVAVGLEPIADPTVDDLAKIWMSLNAGTKSTFTLDHPVVTLLEDLVVGSDNTGTYILDGKIDSLTIWGRTLNDDDLDDLCNDLGSGCTGQTYPFQ